ncbi:glycosyltransferase [Pontiellaceae bacterium B1224]|nr:glycosyltransferase [Pontiellaceae bacterium B1224]
MKVLHLNYASNDGSGNAARRLSNALGRTGVDSEFIFFRPYHLETAKITWLEKKLNGVINILFSKLFGSESLNIIPTSILGYVNASAADVVHLHWINAEMISIRQISKIEKPLVWTFHDMWPICGSEHYVDGQRYGDVYKKKPSNSFKGKIMEFVRCSTWKRKKKHLVQLNFSIITPGNWMTKCAQESSLFGHLPSKTIFNSLNLEAFAPQDTKVRCREKLGLPLGKKIILFGAYNVSDKRKGGDLLQEALRLLQHMDDLVVVVFGRDGKEQLADLETIWLGRIEGDEAMAEVCNCADVVCVPSRQETFGQTASEPLACGVPVVAFNATGLKDVVDHKVNGYLAEPYDPVDLARGLEWVLVKKEQDSVGYDGLCFEARKKTEQCFSMEHIAQQHIDVYNKAITRSKNFGR